MASFTLSAHRLLPRIFWREVWFVRALACMGKHNGRVGLQATSREYGYLLAGMYSPPERYLRNYLDLWVPGRSTKDCVQSRMTALERGVM